MNTPTLAICIPAYNEASVLPRLLASIKEQTVQPDEVWLYDDCGTDETGKIAEAFGARVVRGTENRGCSFGKNRLAERTSCDWVHFVDADDALLPTFVARARDWMTRPSPPEVVVFAFEYRDHTTGELIATCNFDPESLAADPLEYSVSRVINNVALYRRAPFLEAGGFDLDPGVLYNEDAALHTRLAMAGLRFGAETDVSRVVYRRAKSMSASNQVKCCRSQYRVMEKVARKAGRSHGKAIAGRLWEIAAVAGAHLDWETADACVSLATRLHGRRPPGGSPAFASLCLVSPFLALRLRERLIRTLKPQLRKGM
jgi:glycosyltransferase involved in cell wall biosynthesis